MIIFFKLILFIIFLLILARTWKWFKKKDKEMTIDEFLEDVETDSKISEKIPDDIEKVIKKTEKKISKLSSTKKE